MTLSFLGWKWAIPWFGRFADSPRAVPFSGVVFQKQNAAYGYFLATNR